MITKKTAVNYNYDDSFIPHITQNQDEFNFLVNFLISENVQSILILGVDNAGTEYRIAEAYHKINRKCFITGMDCNFNDNLKHSYAKILGKFPNATVNFVKVNFNIPFPFFLLGKYEFTFIDADHAYKSVKNDFGIAEKHTSRFIGFHDIAMDHDNASGPEGGVKKFWDEIKNNYKEFLEKIDPCSLDLKMYGIGIIKL